MTPSPRPLSESDKVWKGASRSAVQELLRDDLRVASVSMGTDGIDPRVMTELANVIMSPLSSMKNHSDQEICR